MQDLTSKLRKAAEERKMVQYVDACRLANLGFLPFGMTTLGAFTATSTKIMDRLAAGKAAATLLDLKEAKRRISLLRSSFVRPIEHDKSQLNNSIN
jgi:hypothetical protein